ncbi:MAG: hypothetical protein ACTJLK_04005 [Anaplasma sp.]
MRTSRMESSKSKTICWIVFTGYVYMSFLCALCSAAMHSMNRQFWFQPLFVTGGVAASGFLCFLIACVVYRVTISTQFGVLLQSNTFSLGLRKRRIVMGVFRDGGPEDIILSERTARTANRSVGVLPSDQIVCLINNEGRIVYNLNSCTHRVRPLSTPRFSNYHGYIVVLVHIPHDITISDTENIRFSYAYPALWTSERATLWVTVCAIRTADALISLMLMSRATASEFQSMLLRRYLKLYSGSNMGNSLILSDVQKRKKEFAYALTYDDMELDLQQEFLANILKNVTETDGQRPGTSLRDMDMLYLLSCSEQQFFVETSTLIKCWLVCEFLANVPLRQALILTAVECMTIEMQGEQSPSIEGITQGVPYLCRQIPGLLESIYFALDARLNRQYYEVVASPLMLYYLGHIRALNHTMPLTYGMTMPQWCAEESGKALAFKALTGGKTITRLRTETQSGKTWNFERHVLALDNDISVVVARSVTKSILVPQKKCVLVENVMDRLISNAQHDSDRLVLCLLRVERATFRSNLSSLMAKTLMAKTTVNLDYRVAHAQFQELISSKKVSLRAHRCYSRKYELTCT